MKRIAFILIVFLLVACNRRYCQPTPRSRDWAVKEVKANADGSGVVKLVRYERATKITKTLVFECLPDSIVEGKRITLDDSFFSS